MRRIFDAILEPAGTDKNIGLFRLFIFAASLILFMLSVFGVVQTIYVWKDGDTYARLGQVGDFFGGTLNPLLTFLTFIGVLATIFLQREELKSTREEIGRQADALETQLHAIAKQNFEATLFQMLSLHNSNVSELRGTDGNYNPISGRAVLAHYAGELSRYYANPQVRDYDPAAPNTWPAIYRKFWGNYRNNLGHYFRLLYNMIRFVDEKTPREGNADNAAARMDYIRIIRAQLSDAELVLIFYNCFSEHGERLLQYARNYNLFDNLDETLLFEEQHREKLRELKAAKLR